MCSENSFKPKAVHSVSSNKFFRGTVCLEFLVFKVICLFCFCFCFFLLYLNYSFVRYKIVKWYFLSWRFSLALFSLLEWSVAMEKSEACLIFFFPLLSDLILFIFLIFDLYIHGNMFSLGFLHLFFSFSFCCCNPFFLFPPHVVYR